MDSLKILSDNMGFAANVYGGGALSPLFIALAILAIVDLILKGFALWRAARLQSPWWFVALLVINSAGILPLIYLLSTGSAYRKLGTPTKTAASVLMDEGTA